MRWTTMPQQSCRILWDALTWHGTHKERLGRLLCFKHMLLTILAPTAASLAQMSKGHVLGVPRDLLWAMLYNVDRYVLFIQHFPLLAEHTAQRFWAQSCAASGLGWRWGLCALSDLKCWQPCAATQHCPSTSPSPPSEKERRKDFAGSDDTASMIKGGGYVGARTRQTPPAKMGDIGSCAPTKRSYRYLPESWAAAAASFNDGNKCSSAAQQRFHQAQLPISPKKPGSCSCKL